jgi:hypothetical protein
MAMFNTDNLMKATLAKLNEIVTGGDENASADVNNFVSWCMPGIPFIEEDFNFLEKGFSVTPSSTAPAAPPADTTSGQAQPAPLSAADETRKLIRNAAMFAMFSDFVPDPAAIYDTDQTQTLDRDSQERLSNIYKNILQFAKVTDMQPSEGEKEKLTRFKGLIYQEIEETNLVDPTKKTTRVVPAPMMQAYTQMEAIYQAAVLLYNSKRIDALTSDNAAAVLDFSMNAPVYREKVQMALAGWVGGGYKNEVDEINAYIDQVTRRSMSIWFAELKDILEKGAFNDSFTGQTFYPTLLYPSSFARNPDWPSFNFYQSDYETNFHKVTNAWGASGGIGFGLWSVGARASGSSERINSDSEFASYEMSFDLAVVKILRPWFGTELFSCHGWKLEQDSWLFGDPQLSDGGNPPQGSFIAYSTHAIFAKNLEVKFDQASWESSSFRSQLNTSASVGWGPFSVSGSYSRSQEDRHFEAHDTGSGFSCPGMQLLGFINRKNGKLPDPASDAVFE